MQFRTLAAKTLQEPRSVTPAARSNPPLPPLPPQASSGPQGKTALKILLLLMLRAVLLVPAAAVRELTMRIAW